MNDTHSHGNSIQVPETVRLEEQRASRILLGGGELTAEPATLDQQVLENALVVNDSIDTHNNINVSRTSRTRTFSFDTANELRQTGLNWTHRITKVLSDAPIVPAAKVFYYAYSYVPADEESSGADSSLTSTRLRVVSSQFETKAEGMIKSWESIKLASVFFIGAAPVILQIQPVYMNVTTRALTVSSGLLATASLISSHIYVQAKDRFTKMRIMEVRWKAARDSSAEFWKLVALPFAFILWSALSFMGTVGYFVWGIAFAIATTDDSEVVQAKKVQYGELVISAVFVTSIPIFAFIKIYNAMAEINGNG